MALIEDRFEDTLRIVQGAERRTVLEVLDGGEWRLPVVRTSDHHPADVRPTRRAIRAQFGIDAFVLECRKVNADNDVARRLLDVEVLHRDGPDTRRNQRWSETPVHLPRPVDGRGWTRPGWWAKVTAWLELQAAAGGWTIRTIEQIRTWEFSCVLHIETDRGDLYFKALPTAYAAEVALLQKLAKWYPANVPAVVAAETRRRWVLLRGCAGRCLEDGAPLAEWQRAARAYAELQCASAARLEQLRTLGCRACPPSALRTAITALLEDEAAFMLGAEHGLTPAELQHLRAQQPWFEAACDELTNSGFPQTIDHGDLWASNIFVGASEPNFIDWTDACLSHPFLSLGPLLRSAGWDPHLTDQANATRRIGAAYLTAWSNAASPARLRQLLALALPLAALKVAVSYWSLTPQPHRQWWMARGVPFFARMALESVPVR